MTKIIKILLVLLSVILLSWVLPATYHFATARRVNYPMVFYSSLLNDFLLQTRTGKQVVYRDRGNNTYSREETDSLMPTFYYRQLITDNRFPDTLLGVAVTPQLLNKTSFFFRHSPRNVNGAKVALYPLLESRSKRVDLSMPDDVCRFTDKEILFIDMETNRVKEEKSARFQQVFQQKGVVLPIRVIGGNPTALKEYDEGYFFTDSRDQLFHFKQMAGSPYLKKVELDKEIVIRHLFVTEFANRTSYAFITDAAHRLYVLRAPDYKLMETAIPSFNPRSDALFIMGNLFDWNVEISNEHAIVNYVLSPDDFSLIDTLSTPLVTTTPQKTARYLFPFELTFASSLHKYFSPRLSDLSMHALWVNILLLLCFVVIHRKQQPLRLLSSALLIAVAGIFAFVPLLLFRRY